MEIYHEAQSFLKTFLVFKNTHAQRTGSKKIRHWRKILISSLRNIRHKIWHKTAQTTENVERYERRRILILLESKSGNIERLLLRFVLNLTWKENLWSCWLSDTEKKSEACLAGNQAVTCPGGAYVGNEDDHWPWPLSKGFFHFTLCRGELWFCVRTWYWNIKLKLNEKTGKVFE